MCIAVAPFAGCDSPSRGESRQVVVRKNFDLSHATQRQLDYVYSLAVERLDIDAQRALFDYYLARDDDAAAREKLAVIAPLAQQAKYSPAIVYIARGLVLSGSTEAVRRGVMLLKPLVAAKDVSATYLLGRFYMQQIFPPPDAGAARRLMAAAACLGHPVAPALSAYLAYGASDHSSARDWLALYDLESTGTVSTDLDAGGLQTLRVRLGDDKANTKKDLVQLRRSLCNQR